MSLYIQKLIAQGEHQQQDFKQRIDDSKKIAKTLVAFANSSGGRILIGIKDNGRISGVDAEEEYHMIQGASDLYCKPEVEFNTKVFKIDNKAVLEITVLKSEERPHYAKMEDNSWKAYVRKTDHNYMVNGVQIKLWKFEKKDQGEELTITEKEEKVFKYLHENQYITFRKFCNIMRQKPWKAENTLAKLIRWDVLRMDRTEKGWQFTLN